MLAVCGREEGKLTVQSVDDFEKVTRVLRNDQLEAPLVGGQVDGLKTDALPLDVLEKSKTEKLEGGGNQASK